MGKKRSEEFPEEVQQVHKKYTRYTRSTPVSYFDCMSDMQNEEIFAVNQSLLKGIPSSRSRLGTRTQRKESSRTLLTSSVRVQVQTFCFQTKGLLIKSQYHANHNTKSKTF